MTTTSRRGMLASSTVVAASLLLAATPPQLPTTTPTTTASWMADPGPIFARKIPQFVREAQRAADSVTAQQIAEFNAWGVTKVPNVVSQEWLDLLREGCELAQDEAGPYAEYLHQPSDTGIFFTDLELARRLPLFAAFSLHGPAAAVAGTLLQSHTIRYLYDQLFIKEAGVHTVTPWHQDNGYWRVRGTQVASVFCPLDPVSRDEGLRFVAGSHRWSQLYNPQHFADGTPYTGTQLPPMPDIDALVQGSAATTAATPALSLLTFDLQPGDVLVFSARTVHGGPGNWGRALSTRWVGDDARYWDRPGEGAVPTGNVHLRDGDLLAHNQLAFPTSWEEPAAV